MSKFLPDYISPYFSFKDFFFFNFI